MKLQQFIRANEISNSTCMSMDIKIRKYIYSHYIADLYIYIICLINNCQAKLQPMALKPHKTNQCKMFIEMIKHRVCHNHLDIVRNVYVECMTKCTLPPSVIVSCQTFWDRFLYTIAIIDLYIYCTCFLRCLNFPHVLKVQPGLKKNRPNQNKKRLKNSLAISPQ